MTIGITCSHCRKKLSESGFIPLKAMVRRNNEWFVLCESCNSINYLEKMNYKIQQPVHCTAGSNACSYRLTA